MGMYSYRGGVNMSVTSDASQTICVIGNAEKTSSCRPERLFFTPVNPSKETQALLESLGTAPIRTGIHAYDLVKRNELSYAIVADAFGLKRYTPDVEEAVDISITYEGYIKKQMDQVDKVRKLEEKILPKEWDYTQIKGISLEAQQKLNKIRPHSIGQASRISGVSPADVSVLLIQLEQYNRSKYNM